MDAFSRLLSSIGQSLGKGLGQVGQSELEQRQRLDTLEAQRKAQVSGQLLQTFTQLLNTQGIQEVDPDGIKTIQQAVTDLALGRIDSPAVQTAISVFPKVADSANKISVYRELATKDLDALSRLVTNTNPEEAQRFLKAVGLQGMYEGLRSRGEILTQADQLGLQLTKEQIESLAAQRKALLAKLEPEIERMKAETALTNEQANALRQRLPLELTNLQLQAQRLGIDIAKGEKELARFDELLDLSLRKLAAEVGLTEEQVNFLREQIRTEVLRQAQIEAQTKLTEAQVEAVKAETELTREKTKLVTEQIASEAQKRNIELTRSALEWLDAINKLAVELSADTPEKAKELLGAFGSFYNLREDFINFVANQIAVAVKETKADKDLQRTGALADVVGKVMNTAIAAESPEAAKKVADALLPPSVSPKLRASVGNMAYYLKTLRLGSDVAAIVEPYMKMLPPSPEDESRVLRELYDSFIRAKGDNPENRRIANGIANTIKGQWALTRTLQSLEREGKKADIDKDKAMTALYKTQAALAPKQFGLEEQKLAFEREQFSFEKWYKTEQVKLGWARLELDKLIAQAKSAGASEDIVSALKNLASVAKTTDDLATRALANRLRELGKDTCARKLESSGSITILEAVRADDTECNRVIQQVLTDKGDPRNREVAEQAERAVELGRFVTNLALGFVAGGTPSGSDLPSNATPGLAIPETPGTGGRPFGTAAPGGATTSGRTTQTGSAPSGAARGALGSDFASGAKTAFNRIRQFGTQIPNDPKLAGAMVFVYGTEFGPWYNPFQVTKGAGVPMQTITITKENGVEEKVEVPVGPDKGFQGVIDADKPGTRKKALAIDSAIAFGSAWIFPNETPKPRMLAKYIREDFRRDNPGVFRRADYFKNERGEVDMVSVASGYAAMSLERLGVPVQYNRTFTTLLRTLAQNDLEILEMRKPLPPEMAKERYLNLVRYRYENDPKLIEDARRQYDLSVDASRNAVIRRVLESAMMLYDATRLSNIGSLVLGGGR